MRLSTMTQALMAQECLANHSIESHIVNKKDSMYPMLGAVEVLVHPEQVAQAHEILRKEGF